MVLEAVQQGARTVALSSFVKGNSSLKPYNGRLLIARHRAFTEHATPEGLLAMSQFAIDRFGAPYGFREMFRIAIRVALGRLNIKIPPMLAPKSAFICSEYAAACYAEVGIKIAWDGLGFIAPSDFAEAEEINPVAVVQTLVG